MKLFFIIFVLGMAASVWAFNLTNYEQPQYDVISQKGSYEIRGYKPYIVAETRVNGDFRNSGNSAFSILAGYIFGKNVDQEKMAMTAPVIAQSKTNIGTKMNMTVPVTAEAVSEDNGSVTGYIYQFVMERKYDMDTLPIPNDPRVTFKQVPKRIVAVKTYSGQRRGSNYEQNLQSLLADLIKDGYRIKGQPQAAFYNGPWTPSFLRRNEIILEIAGEV